MLLDNTFNLRLGLFLMKEFLVFDSIEIPFVLPTNADSTINFIEKGFQSVAAQALKYW